ncbi:hypothetical protein AB1Y20_011610 [Prymnesium parvum]|uniref:START domain-containing protein n=1 Tax=Prymnesium parvum TaxID=97485 RepID=A0AB34IHL7_PRYPA
MAALGPLVLFALLVVLLLLERCIARLLRRLSPPLPPSPPAATTPPQCSSLSWDEVMPLGALPAQMAEAVSASQHAKARAAGEQFAALDAAIASCDDTLHFTSVADAHARLALSLAFADGLLYFSTRCAAFPLGLLPSLTILHEFDLILAWLPPLIRSQVDHIRVAHSFAPNDQLVASRIRGFGPIPGIDDVWNFVVFRAGAALVVHVEDPPRGATTFRKFALPPPPHGYSRLHGLLVVAHATPSRAPTPPYARLDVAFVGKVFFPVPRWLLPTPIIRWFVPFVLRLVWPMVFRLNGILADARVQRRVQSDVDGFYAALERQLPAFGSFAAEETAKC